MTLATLKCSGCGAPHERVGQRFCHGCHAAYQADWRKRENADRRAIARVVARYARDAGTIERRPCQVCGSSEAEMHHPDHEMERFVYWLCREHHMAWHAHWKETVLNAFAVWVEIARACDALRKSEAAA
jgi:hypothetical protein